jgi:hypothetical protein
MRICTSIMRFPTTDRMSESTAPLVGEALKARVEELKPAPEAELAIACGYVTAKGGANTAAFTKALAYAHGILQPPTKDRPGRSLGFEVTVGTKGQVVLSGGYGALIGIAPGDTVGIQHIGNSLIVHPAGVVPTFRDEPVPAAGEPTYDALG